MDKSHGKINRKDSVLGVKMFICSHNADKHLSDNRELQKLNHVFEKIGPSTSLKKGYSYY